MQRPHFVAISPYDPQKHVWILDDHKHAIFKMTNDGKQIVQTIGTYGVPGNDEQALQPARPSSTGSRTAASWWPTATTAPAS